MKDIDINLTTTICGGFLNWELIFKTLKDNLRSESSMTFEEACCCKAKAHRRRELPMCEVKLPLYVCYELCKDKLLSLVSG